MFNKVCLTKTRFSCGFLHIVPDDHRIIFMPIKTTLFSIVACFLLIIASCKKHDFQPHNFWRINGVTHEVASIYYIFPSPYVEMVFVRDGDSTTRSSSVAFDFDKLPTTSGDYEIGPYVKQGQMQILATSYFGGDDYGIYSSTGNDHIKAHVTVKDGKITIDVPEVWVRNTKGTDSVKFSAHVYQ